MERWKRRAVDLICGLASTDKQDASVIPYRPQKTEISPERRRTLRRVAPELVGVSSLRLVNMLNELESEGRAKIHGILVVKDGRVICEASAPGYSIGLWHLSHSMSKTVTGMAIGLLVDDGVLNLGERLTDIFPEYSYADPRFADITVAHLLSMSSGVSFSEIGVVTETEWTTAFFGSGLNFAPGERFAYNSMNSYILAKIAVRRSGKSLTALVAERIFAPLGIRQYFWELGPEGVEKGGFGLYLSAESWAKLGLMMLGGGSYMGRRILSERWVSESLITRGVSPEETGEFNYGYHLWVHRRSDEFLFNGMLGQNVWVCPSNGIVTVINSGNNELFQESPALHIIRKYLAGELADRLRLSDRRVLRLTCDRFFESRAAAHPLTARRSLAGFLGIRSATPYDDRWSVLVGDYSMRRNNLSLLPVFVRCMQNNLRSGIESIELRREGEGLFMQVHGPSGEHRFGVGLYGYRETLMSFGGELYRMRSLGEVVRGREGQRVFRIEMIFPELPNSRVIEMSVTDENRVLMRLSEVPNERIVSPFISSLSATAPRLGFALGMLERRYGHGFLESKLERIFAPEITLIRRGCPDEEELLLCESEREEAENATVRSLSALVLRFMRDAPATDDSEGKGSAAQGRGVLQSVIERIRRLISGE